MAIIALTTAAAASSHAAQAAGDPSSPRADQAVRAAKTHPGTTEFGADQGLQPVDTIVDGNGTSHVRMHRTYEGLPVVGGDLVVHQSKSGAFQGSSQTLDQPLDLAVTPTVSRAAASTKALAPSKVTDDIAGQKVDGSTLVVDATGCQPTPGLEGPLRRQAVRRHPQPAGQLRRRQHGQGAAHRAGDRERRRLGPDPLQRHGPAAGHPVGVVVPAQGPDPRRHLHDRPEERRGLLRSARCSASGCKAGTRSPARAPPSATARTTNRATVGADAQYGSNETWDYFKTRPRPQRHLRHRQPAPTTARTTARTT